MQEPEGFKGTKGEWFVRQDYNTLQDEIGVPGKALCTVWTRRVPRLEEGERLPQPSPEGAANSALICASKDLLAALQIAFSYIGQPVDGGDIDGDDEDAIAISTKMRVGDWRQIRAAIARAVEVKP